MERVVNSVQQILQECEEMVNQTTDCEYVDVTSLAKTLRDECESLRTLFNEHPELESDIKTKKQVVERTAIRLEFYMAIRLGLYTERKTLRAYAYTIYADCRQLTLAINDKQGVTSNDIVYWGSATSWALQLYFRSTHVIFELDMDDEARIKDIVENMKIMKERVNYG